MKLPWDKKYIAVAFHVIITIILAYVLYLFVNFAAYTITNFAEVRRATADGIKQFFSVLSAPIIAFVIAYLLDPVADFFQNAYERFFDKERGNSRAVGTAATYAFILLFASLIIFFIMLKIGYGKDGHIFLEAVMDSVNKMRNDLGELYAALVYRFNEWGIAEPFTNTVANLINGLIGFAGSVENITDTVASAGSSIANFLLSFIIAFYFLKDKQRIISSISRIFGSFVTPKYGNRVKKVLFEADAVFSGYIRGQLMDAAIMGTLFSVVLSLMGVNFGILIGVFAGISNIVPYVGAVVAFIISVTVAFVGGSPVKAVYTAVAMLILQQIDATIVIPRVIGKRVELSPVLVIISITVGGKLFGVLGMIFAVPVCAVIKIFLLRYINAK